MAVWGSDSDHVYVVGDGGTMLQCAAGASACTVLDSGTPQYRSAVWGSDASNVYVVGSAGTILRGLP